MMDFRLSEAVVAKIPFITSEAWRVTFAGLDKAARTDLFCITHANAGKDGRIKLVSLI